MHSEEPDFEALSAAVTEVRRLITHLRKTQAAPELLREVERDAAALADKLAPFDHAGPYAQAMLVVKDALGPVRSSDDPAAFFPYSPAIGPLNPVAPPVEFVLDGREMRAEHVFDAPYNGPPTAVHGGVIALVFDELLGTLGAMLDTGGFTGTLKIVYRSLTPIGVPIRMRAFIDRTEGVKVFIKGTMHRPDAQGEVLCAEAEGIFIRPKVSIVRDALGQARAPRR